MLLQMPLKPYWIDREHPVSPVHFLINGYFLIDHGYHFQPLLTRISSIDSLFHECAQQMLSKSRPLPISLYWLFSRILNKNLPLRCLELDIKYFTYKA